MRKIIEVESLSFSYGGESVFSGVTFTVREGDFVALIGSNGAGKSTLVKLLLGELTPTEGSIRLFGQDAAHFHDWPKIGYLPQNAARAGQGFPASVREVVEANLYASAGLFRFPSRALRARAAEALRQVDMGGYEKRLVGELSGGQQQRVMLARVLAGEPQVMILDEPVSGVDQKTVETLYQLLTRLNRERNLTILMVTHDVARSSAIASRVMCLEERSMVELEPHQVKEELRHRHKHPTEGGDGNGHPAV
jgi:zinc transport system ATP-binding protein